MLMFRKQTNQVNFIASPGPQTGRVDIHRSPSQGNFHDFFKSIFKCVCGVLVMPLVLPVLNDKDISCKILFFIKINCFL